MEKLCSNLSQLTLFICTEISEGVFDEPEARLSNFKFTPGEQLRLAELTSPLFGVRCKSLMIFKIPCSSSKKIVSGSLVYWGSRDGLAVCASDLGPEGREFEPWPLHPRCVLRQDT